MSTIIDLRSAISARFNPTGNIAATNVQAAIEELDSETVRLTGNQNIAGNKNFTSTTPSSSTTTGALTVAGGLGVTGAGFFGGNLTINNPSLLESSLRINSNFPGVSGSSTNSTVASLRLEGGGGFGNEAFRARITARHESLAAVLGTRLSFFTRAAAFGSDNENMALTASGNLLVGTTTDNGTDRLQVAGNVNATQYRLSALNTAPASATATGVAGEIRVTTTHIFVCIATNTWVRAALTTW